MAEHTYPMDAVSRWHLTDATILSVHVKPSSGGGAETFISLSSDEATTRAIMDTLTTSAFQWCELRGYDPAATIEERGGSAGRAGEWVNKKAGGGTNAGAGTNAGGFASTRGGELDVKWHERPEHCGWLTKKGEHFSTWRKRWFVLKDKKLAWFKTNDVTAASKPRGLIHLDKVGSVCGATRSDAGRANAVELIGSLDAERAGCKFLVADSERECDAWCAAIDAAINCVSAGGGAGTGGGAGSSTVTTSSGLASQLQQGFAQATAHAAHANPDIELNITGYTAGARAPSPGPSQNQQSSYPYGGDGGGSSYGVYGAPMPPAGQSPGGWETYYTNEGVPYYVNSVTGVTQWEAPR